MPSSDTAAGYPADPAQKWEVTAPNGAVTVYYHEWQAAQAMSVTGGTMREIDGAVAAPPGEPDAADADQGPGRR